MSAVEEQVFVNVGHNNIGPVGAKALAGALRDNVTVTTLDMDYSNRDVRRTLRRNKQYHGDDRKASRNHLVYILCGIWWHCTRPTAPYGARRSCIRTFNEGYPVLCSTNAAVI